MKICITSAENNENSVVDLRFGRCRYFAIYDDEAGKFDFIENPGISSVHGAGIAAAQEVVNKKIDAVLTGNIGPNAMKLLKGSNIKMYRLKEGTVEKAIDSFKEENMVEITNAAPAHFGMGKRQ